MRVILVMLFMLSALNTSLAQSFGRPKKIREKGVYKHELSELVFPTMIDKYERKSLGALDKEKHDIVAEYSEFVSKTTISVYVYKGGSADEDRLRYQFLSAAKAIAVVSGREVSIDPHYCHYPKDGYKINGLEAFIDDGSNSMLQVYECGEWMFKIRATSGYASATELQQICAIMTNALSPVLLVKAAPLNPRGSITIAPASIPDSFFKCIITAALSEVNWGIEHVDSMERLSGYPCGYLDKYLNTFRTIIACADTSEAMPYSVNTKNYIKQLRALNESGYLDEFVMEQKNYLMITPDVKSLDLKGYSSWKKEHPITIDLNKRYYVIKYAPSEK